MLDALARLGGAQGGLPLALALVVLGDPAVVRGDVGHGGVPVAAGQVEGGEGLVVAVLVGDLVQRLLQLVLGLRKLLGARALVEHLLVEDRHARPGVVGDAVELALEGAGVLQALDPGVGVVVLLRIDLGEGPVEDVGHGLGVAELDHVGELVAAQRGVELLGLVAPLLVLDLDLDLGVLLLELGVDVLDQLGPGALGVVHQPDGERLVTLLGGLGGVVPTVPAAGDEAGHHRRGTDRRYELVLHVLLLRDARSPPARRPRSPLPPDGRVCRTVRGGRRGASTCDEYGPWGWAGL